LENYILGIFEKVRCLTAHKVLAVSISLQLWVDIWC